MYDISLKMAGKFTLVSCTNVILAMIMLTNMQRVKSAAIKIDCGPIYDPYKELERPYRAHINWLPILGSVIYPNHSTAVGSIAEFRCEKGYYVRGAKHAVCGSNGKWKISEEELFCDRINCERPEFDIKHGKINTSVERPLAYILNSIYWVTCDKGYTPSGSALRVCLANGTDNNKGIWSQRNENGEILQGGDSVPECMPITDTNTTDCEINIAWCNKTDTIPPQAEAVSSNVIERNLLVFVLSCAVLVGFVVSILLIIRLKINKTKQTGDAAERGRLLKTEEKQKEELQDCVSEKEGLERELGVLKSEKEEVLGQLRQLYEWQRLRQITNGRCSVCTNNTIPMYNHLESKRERLVNMILEIKKLIEEIDEYESFILDNKETFTGSRLLKLIGEFKGLFDSCDTSRPKYVTFENESEMQCMRELEEVRKLRVEMEIPCLHCVQLEKDCERKEYQIDRLSVMINFIENELVGKIKNFSKEVSLYKTETCEEVIDLNLLVGEINGMLKGCDNILDLNRANKSNQQANEDTYFPRVRGTSIDTQSGRTKFTDNESNAHSEESPVAGTSNVTQNSQVQVTQSDSKSNLNFEYCSPARSTTSGNQSKECRNPDSPNNAASENGNLEQKGSSGEDKGSMTADDLSKPERGDEKFVDTVTEDEELCASANKFTTESKHQEHSEGNVPGNNDEASMLVFSVSAGGHSKHIQSKSDNDS